MSQNTNLTTSTNLQKAICWIGEIMQENPDKKRQNVLADAQVRFDLNPAECEFLNSNFAKVAAGKSC